MKITSDMVNYKEHYSSCLTRDNFPVNIRLYKSNPGYRSIISSVINHMTRILNTKYDDYSTVKGVSGANVGIPFRIIIIGRKKKSPLVMLNPMIMHKPQKYIISESNCGSMNLDEPIKVKRWPKIRVKYFDVYGELCDEEFDREHWSFTIQHEVDHTRGKLITSREVKE